MSWIHLSVRRATLQKSCQGVVDYIEGHLQSAQEGGVLLRLAGYCDRNNRVLPVILNPSIWTAAGLRVLSRVLQPELLMKLCQGMDITGRQLTQTRMIKAPVETLITLPCEVSEALRDFPAVASRILHSMVLAYLRWLDQLAVRVRVGGNKSVDAYARTLSAYFPHALNQAREAQYHAHVLTFGPALDPMGYWRTHNIYSCLRRFHHPGGVRDLLTQVLVAAAAKEGFIVDITPGKVADGIVSGATVTCPDGRVIKSRTVSRLRSAQVLETRELKRVLGCYPLTKPELAVVHHSLNQGLDSIPQSKVRLRDKLVHLGLLGPTQGSPHQLTKALVRMDKSMAIVEAALRDLPFLEGSLAAELVRNRRGHIRYLFPDMRTEAGPARSLWRQRYDRALDLVGKTHTGLSLKHIPERIRDTIFLLHRAGILLRSCENKSMKFRLSRIGEERYLRGKQEQRDAEAALPSLIKLALKGSSSSAMTRGRLMSAGVRVRGDEVEFFKLGRTVMAKDLLMEVGISPTTPIAFDLKWWAHYWDRRTDLAPILARSALHPEELPPNVQSSLNNPRNPYRPLHLKKKKQIAEEAPLPTPQTPVPDLALPKPTHTIRTLRPALQKRPSHNQNLGDGKAGHGRRR